MADKINIAGNSQVDLTDDTARGDVSTRDQWKHSADNLVINDGTLENTGDAEDEAQIPENEVRMSEDYGHDIHRKGHDNGVLFDSIDRNEGVTALGPKIPDDDL